MSKKLQTEVAAIDAELMDLKVLFGEIVKNYMARLEKDIDSIRAAATRAQKDPDLDKSVKKDIQQIHLALLTLNTKPEKGRRKDLKKIEDLIGEMQSLIERWP